MITLERIFEKALSTTSLRRACAGRKRVLPPNRIVIVLLALMTAIFFFLPAHASLHPNALHRISIKPVKNFTRITIATSNQPRYLISRLSDGRLRVVLSDTDAPLLKKFRRYADSNIESVVVSRRGDDLFLTFRFATGSVWRDVSLDGVDAVVLDVGKRFGSLLAPEHRPGREKIWSGVEKLVRDFDPPLKSGLPFIPTDRKFLSDALDVNAQNAFLAAEGALYKGNLSEAEELFPQFLSQQSNIRGLAFYRLGEVCYHLQKYRQALAAFREAEKIWPEYLNLNPGVTFCYGDSIARSGDLTSARAMLSELIARLADKKIAPVLLVRLADILEHQENTGEALGIYRTVSANFVDNKARWIASLRLLDNDFMKVTPWNYRDLSDAYLKISLQSNDIDIREESLFKHALLESLYGETQGALRQTVMFQKQFPRGVYATVCRKIREVLVAQEYRQSDWTKNPSGLIRFVEEHQDYLIDCAGQPDFLPNVAKAYEQAGTSIELVKTFVGFLDRQWPTTDTPYIYEVVAEHAGLLGDDVMAEKYLRAFIQKFPSNPRARLAQENLGALLYGAGKYQETSNVLLWILDKNVRANIPESYYYLGRSLWMLKQPAPAYQAMEMYMASEASQGKNTVSILSDAYYVAVSAREALGDPKRALHLLESGLKKPALREREELLYRAGELSLKVGNKETARNYFEIILKDGKDSDWQKLARYALGSFDLKTTEPPAK